MFKLDFETANAAFADDPAVEVARILRDLAQRIDNTGLPFGVAPVRDVNGNRVGNVEFDQ